MKKTFSVFFSIAISFSASAALAADSTTTNLGLVKPEAVAGSWGAKINTDLDILDTKFPGGVVSHAATADALTANGTNCSAGQAPLGVDAAGNAEGCFTPSAGMADPGGNGMVARTALNTTINRTITGTANEITLSNGDGVAGNPTISAHAALARDAEVQSGSLLVCSDAGANDTYTCTMTPTLLAYATGQVVFFKANTANTGAATLNIDSLGAKSILKQKGGALADNDIKAGQWSCLIYDGTNFELCNAVPNASTATVTDLTQNISFSGDISPTAFLEVDDWNPTGLSTASVIRITTTASGIGIIHGIAGGADGRILVLVNANATAGGDILLMPETSTTAANRFKLSADNHAVGIIQPGDSLTLIYDSTTSRWRPKHPVTMTARVYLPAAVTNNNVTANTIADVTGLKFLTAGPAAGAAPLWNFRFVIHYTAALATTGSRWSINGPAAPSTLMYRSQYSLSTTTQTINEALSTYDVPAASNLNSASTGSNQAIIEGVVSPAIDGGNGTVTARFASEVSSSAIVAVVGSYVEYSVNF